MIDSHCHLYFQSIRENFNHIIQNIKSNNINSVLSINTNPKDFNDHYELVKNYKSIFLSYGFHPDEINNNSVFIESEFLKFCSNKKVIAIGETGLDFYRSTEFKKEQYYFFEKHIESSLKTKLPLIIHQRNSEKEIIEVLDSYNRSKNLNVVFHCFTGSSDLLNFCIKNNFFLSLSGIVTFKNADNLRNVIKKAPLDNILIETDSPFLSPVPMRGKLNEPANVKYTAQYLSEFFNISFDEMIKITDNNFYNLFSKAKRYNQFE